MDTTRAVATRGLHTLLLTYQKTEFAWTNKFRTAQMIVSTEMIPVGSKEFLNLGAPMNPTMTKKTYDIVNDVRTHNKSRKNGTNAGA